MIPNTLKTIWAEGRPTINGWLSIGNSFTAEIVAAQGYDSITIDLQHGALDYSDALPMFQAMRASGVTLLARILQAHFYRALPGALLEGMGKLFAGDVMFYAYPMPREAIVKALGPAADKVLPPDSTAPLIW